MGAALEQAAEEGAVEALRKTCETRAAAPVTSLSPSGDRARKKLPRAAVQFVTNSLLAPVPHSWAVISTFVCVSAL
jgi:hypothetical protein